MKKQHTIIFISFLIVLLGLSAALVIFMARSNETANEDNRIRTFADWTDLEEFQGVPAMIVRGTGIGEATDYGAENYVIDVNGTTLTDYQNYLVTLEEAGYEKYVDNGENGLEGAVYTSTYTKNNLVLTVTHVVNIDKTYISACFDLPMSEQLFYDESYVADNIQGRQTKLHMLELYDFGNSFIIELKNGHFIINDGGMEEDTPYLFDYLEALASEGEKPVVDAWIISHAHEDHMGILQEISSDAKYCKRLYVEGFYFNEPSDMVSNDLEPNTREKKMYVDAVADMFQTTDGKRPEVYRPQTGQRYYFNDIVIDVIHAQEQLVLEDYNLDFNDSGTWLMYTIEGQKCLLGADGDEGGMRQIMSTYSQEYMTMDIFQALHHSSNTWNTFTDFCTTKTILAADASFRDTAANNYLLEQSIEWLAWGDGTKIMTFPYEVGTAESLPNIEWIYHPLRGMIENK